jgi:hypothetical protein
MSKISTLHFTSLSALFKRLKKHCYTDERKEKQKLLKIFLKQTKTFENNTERRVRKNCLIY